MGSLNPSYDFSPYTAVTLLIYRGKTNVGRIEIEPQTLDDAPAATIHCSLEYAEMFNYEAAYSLLYKVGSIHLDDEDRYSAENLKLRITQTLTQFLWDRLNSTAELIMNGMGMRASSKNYGLNFMGNSKNFETRLCLMRTLIHSNMKRRA